jgi:hypothetical protein
MLIHEFPFDYRLDTLVEACSARRMQPRLSALSGNRALKIEAIDIVRYVPEKRCLIRYDVSTDGGRETWLGKVTCTTTTSRADTCRRPVGGRARGVGPRVPGVVGILPDVRLVLQRHVDGTSSTIRLGRVADADAPGGDRARRRTTASPRPCQSHGGTTGTTNCRARAPSNARRSTRRWRAPAVSRRSCRGGGRRQPGTSPCTTSRQAGAQDPGGVTLIDFDTASTSCGNSTWPTSWRT